MFLSLFFVVTWVTLVHGYCTLLGSNPGFTGPPIVEQVSTTSVQVSWEGLVYRIECADEFLVKSWDIRNAKDYKLSELLPTSQFSFIVTDLDPNKGYVFQVIARENKGRRLGVEYNKSETTLFRITKYQKNGGKKLFWANPGTLLLCTVMIVFFKCTMVIRRGQ